MVAEIKTITYGPKPFPNVKLILGAIVVVVIAFFEIIILGFPSVVSYIIAAQIVIFFLLFQRPIWAMVSLIVGQLTANNFMFPLGVPISVRFFWTIMALLILLPVLWKSGGIKLGSSAGRVIIPAILLFCWITLTNFINTGLGETIQYLRVNSTALVILILLPAAAKNEKDIKRLAIVVLIVAFVSALFALQQHYNFSFLGRPYTLYGIYEVEESYARVPGLSESPVQLGFNLPTILLPMIAIFFIKAVNSRFRKLLLLFIIIIVAALYYTYTRSGIYALALGLLFLFFFLKGKGKKELFLVILILGIGFWVLTQNANNRYSQGFGDDSSSTGRLVLWQAGTHVAIDNPILGIGAGRFQEASLAYASAIDSSLMKDETGAGNALGLYEAHNDFITVWASFGTFALLTYLWLLVAVFREFFEAYRHSRTLFIRGIAAGCFCAVAGYIVNAFTHNVMDSSMLLWILSGLSIALNKIVFSKRYQVTEDIR